MCSLPGTSGMSTLRCQELLSAFKSTEGSPAGSQGAVYAFTGSTCRARKELMWVFPSPPHQVWEACVLELERHRPHCSFALALRPWISQLAVQVITNQWSQWSHRVPGRGLTLTRSVLIQPRKGAPVYTQLLCFHNPHAVSTGLSEIW